MQITPHDSPLTLFFWHQSSLQRISDLSSTPKTLSYGVKIAKIARGLRFAYDTKLVAMATSLEESEKMDRIKKTHANTFHLVKRSWNRSSRYWDIFPHSKKKKKKEINASKIYSPVGRFAERAKKAQFFVKGHSVDWIRGMATEQSPPRAGGHSCLAGGRPGLWVWSGVLQWVLSVCLSVCLLGYFRNNMPKLTSICVCYLLWPWLSPPIAALRYVLRASGSVDDRMLSYNGPSCGGVKLPQQNRGNVVYGLTPLLRSTDSAFVLS